MESDLLALLASMDVKLPAGTKATASQLNQKLAKALDGAQYITDVLPKSSETLSLNDLPLWRDGSVSQGLSRNSMNEIFGLPNSSGASNSAPVGSDAFMGLRWVVGMIGRAVDTGNNVKEVVIEHEDLAAVLYINLVEVRVADKDIPVVVVRYYYDKKDASGKFEHYEENPPPGVGRMLLKASTPMMALFIKLLELNAPRIPSSHKGNKSKKKRHITTSFVLPVGAIEPAKIGELSKDDLCVVCGKKTRQRCKRCLDVPYCSETCETKAWPQHKLSCKSLEVVEWTPFIISSEGPLGARFQTAVPRGAPVRASRANIVDANAIPPNTHGDNPFLIKVQYNTSPWMMVYDRARSMTVHLAKDDQRAGCWERLARLIEAKGFTPMYPRYKLYCWGKRTGDYEISITLDELPEQGLPW